LLCYNVFYINVSLYNVRFILPSSVINDDDADADDDDDDDETHLIESNYAISQ